MPEWDSAEPGNTGECRKLLSISPFSEDHERLRAFLNSSEWIIRCASSLHRAQRLLAGNSFSLAVCEQDLCPGSWKDILAGLSVLPRPPLLIVTSLHADDRLWSEALNLGAYDVLTKPLQNAEVARAVGLALWRCNPCRGASKAIMRAAAG